MEELPKCCKERLLESLSQLVESTGPSSSKKVIPNFQVKQFSLLIRVLKLSDELYFIEKSPDSLVLFLSALSIYTEIFAKAVMKTTDANLKLWDSLLVKEGVSKHQVLLTLSSQFVHPNRIYLYEKRQEDEVALNMQILLRSELLKKETEAVTELDIVGDVELDATVIDLDEACIIIQNAERMYQSLSRFSHLVDVRQKALDIRTTAQQGDPIKAIIKVQAITRGYLTRKKVHDLRTAENTRLGLNIEALLQSTRKHQTTVFLKDVKPEQRFFAEDAFPPPPKTLAQLEAFLKEHFFTSDPLTLRDPPLASELRKVDEMTEHYFGELVLAEALKLEPPPHLSIKFDDLVSTQVLVKTKGKTAHVDLRNFLYAMVVIPHALSAWSFFDIPRKNILLVGDRGSGKSAWSNAMAQKCLAPRIRVSKRLFTRKFTRRKRLLEIINQFARMDKYCMVEFDRLEMFSGKKQRRTPIRGLITKLFHSLRKSSSQIIGLSRTADLNDDILAGFDYVVMLKAPIGIDRYSLLTDALGRRYGEKRLQKTPQRLLELSRITNKLNIGETIEKVDKKFAAPLPPP